MRRGKTTLIAGMLFLLLLIIPWISLLYNGAKEVAAGQETATATFTLTPASTSTATLTPALTPTATSTPIATPSAVVFLPLVRRSVSIETTWLPDAVGDWWDSIQNRIGSER